MSKLQRLNPKLSAEEEPAAIAQREMHGSALSGTREHLRQQLHLDVDPEALPVTAPTSSAVPQGRDPPIKASIRTPLASMLVTGVDMNRDGIPDVLQHGKASSSWPRLFTAPATVAGCLETDTSVLLSELPSRDNRREWHVAGLCDDPFALDGSPR
jgi:hypothetical protein